MEGDLKSCWLLEVEELLLQCFVIAKECIEIFDKSLFHIGFSGSVSRIPKGNLIFAPRVALEDMLHQFQRVLFELTIMSHLVLTLRIRVN
jgi:hypothetical protein